MKRKMTEDEVLMEVAKAIRRVFQVCGLQIVPSTMLIADLGAQEIEFLDLASELESALDIDIDFRKLLTAKRLAEQRDVLDVSIQDIVDFLLYLGTFTPARSLMADQAFQVRN